MTGRLAIYAIPTIAVAAMAFVLLGPGRPRAAIGARVRGAPVMGADVLSLRLETVRRLHGVDDAAPGVDLVLQAESAGVRTEAARATTGPDGIAELTLPLRLQGPVDVAVLRAGAGAPLALGRVAPRPAAQTWAQLGVVPGNASGELDVRVDVLRGALAAPFPEAVRITVERMREPVRDAELEVSVQGGEPSSPGARTDARGGAILFVKSLAHRVEMTVTAKAPGGRGTWDGTLPVRPGAIWVDPAHATTQKLTLVSPAPRERAYVSFIGESGRTGGAVVPLAPDGNGFHAGSIPLEPPKGRWLHVVVAGDPYEQGAGTVAWPLVPPEGSVETPHLELLLDGVPAAAALDGQRSGKARRIGIGIVTLGAALEIFLLVLHARMSQQKLEKHLVGASAVEERAPALAAAKDTARLRTISLVALVVLAFSVVGALALMTR